MRVNLDLQADFSLNQTLSLYLLDTIKRRYASINDLPIAEADRKYHWPLGPRPDDHPGLSDLGL